MKMEDDESCNKSEGGSTQQNEENTIEDISLTLSNETMQCDTTPEKLPTGTPNIYQLVSDSFEDHFNELTSILNFHKPFQVEERLIEYLQSKPLRCDWNAVWRCENPELDILVKVVQIHPRKFMTASIEIQDCLDFDDSSRENLSQRLNEYIESTHGKVLLLDLYPICSDNDDLHLRELASAIEQLRFFYDYIWRVTDEEDSDDCVYATRSLHPRLKLYYEMKTNPSSVDAKKYTEVVQEYQAVYRELMRKRLAIADDSDNADSEMSERDLIEMTKLYDCLTRLSKTLSVMETPALRMLFSCGGTKCGAYPSSEARGARSDGSTVTHIVCDKLKAFMVQNLASDTEIMHHRSLDAALQCSFDGDDVKLYPGTYSSWGLSDLQQSINIIGVGERGLVVIDTEDIPVELSSYQLVIENVLFTCESTSGPMLSVKRGTTEFKRCLFEGGSVGILAHGQCSLVVKNCKIQGASKSGIFIKQGCSFDLTSSTVVQCGSSKPLRGVENYSDTGGIVIQMDYANDEKTKVTLNNNEFIENYGYDICLADNDVKENRLLTCQEFLNQRLLQVNLEHDNDLNEHKIGLVGDFLV